jgi:hypothetical protein
MRTMIKGTDGETVINVLMSFSLIAHPENDSTMRGAERALLVSIQ